MEEEVGGGEADQFNTNRQSSILLEQGMVAVQLQPAAPRMILSQNEKESRVSALDLVHDHDGRAE